MTLLIVSAALISFIVVCILTDQIIRLSISKGLFDEPTEDRKIHLRKTPNLGGVAIFLSATFSISLFYGFNGPIPDLHLIFGATSMIFLLGLGDDLVGINPYKKLAVQICAALIISYSPNLRITDLYGFMGLTSINTPISILITTVFLVLLMNAYNLFDGIDWLAGSFALTTITVFSVLFWNQHESGLFSVCIILASSLLGFLLYNMTPARIFMGDSGSLTIGMIIGILCIKLLQLEKGLSHTDTSSIIIALLTLPVFDTIRVFCTRICKGQSPFKADKNHLHHRLLSLPLEHLPSTFILLVCKTPAILLAFTWKLNISIKIPILIAVPVTTYYIVYYLIRFIKSKQLPAARVEPANGRVIAVDFLDLKNVAEITQNAKKAGTTYRSLRKKAETSVQA